MIIIEMDIYIPIENQDFFNQKHSKKILEKKMKRGDLRAKFRN